MESFGRSFGRYLDLRALVAGSAALLGALLLMPSGTRGPYEYDSSPFPWGVSHPAAVLSGSLFLLGWLLAWAALRFLGGVGLRALLGLAVYLLVGIGVRGVVPYTPLWSPPGFRRDVLDRVAGWLSWPRYLAGAPVSGFGAAEAAMLLLVALVAAWLLGRRYLSPARGVG